MLFSVTHINYFYFGQNFIEEKKLETQLDTATHICEDLKNISGPDLGKLMHISWYAISVLNWCAATSFNSLYCSF